jgi:hypothetical protein
MAFEWNSVDQIRSAFGLPPDMTDLREIRRLLRTRLRDIHPDSTDGEFKSAEIEQEFHDTQSAIDFIDRQLTTGLPAINRETLLAVTEMTQLFAGALRENREADRRNEQARRLEDRQRRVNEQLEADVRRRYRFLKITAGVVAGFFGFLSLFPEKFTTHPVFVVVSQFTDSLDITVGLALLYLMLAGGVAVVYFWREEQRELQGKKQFLSDAGVERIVKSKNFLARLGSMGGFTRADLVRTLEEHRLSKDHNLLSEVADLILEKLAARGAVHRVPKPSLTDAYELDFSVFMELRPPPPEPPAKGRRSITPTD